MSARGSPSEPDGRAIKLREDTPWADKVEAVQFLTKVFARIHKLISSDIVLAKLDPQQREFLIENTKQAFVLERQIPHKGVASRMFTTMMIHSIMLAITHRNIGQNELFNVIKGLHDTEPHMERSIAGDETRTTNFAREAMGRARAVFGMGGQKTGQPGDEP